MIIRCKQCHGSIPMQRGAGWGIEISTTCPTCEQRYKLKIGSKAHAKLFGKARGIAREHEIDMPGAYSVALGIMDVDEVLALHQQPPTVVTPDEDEKRGRYDPAFRKSIEAGSLTEEQAAQRGRRDALARQYVERHGLSMESALAVADNRTSLLAAIRANKAPETTPVQVVGAPRSRASLVGSSAVVLAVLVGVSLGGYSTLENFRAREDPVKVRTDGRGQVLRIEGPDAIGVLDAYCGSGQRVNRYECVGLRHSPRDGDDVMLGLFRKRAEPELEWAIYISRDRGGRHWVAGNGRFPVEAFQAPGDQSVLGDALPAGQ